MSPAATTRADGPTAGDETSRGAGSDHALGPDELAFVLCVETNRLEPQARLLCESLRTFGGRFRRAPIFAVSPRSELALGGRARQQLESLDVTYVVEPLNDTGHAYGTINRIVAGAWAEVHCGWPYLVLLDTDTILVGEPSFVHADVGVRPVDCKGAASSGAGDPVEAYWARLCAFGGITPSQLPTISTTIDRVPIRAAYNGGFAVLRRDLGILQETRRIFFAAMAESLRPWPGQGLDVRASTGLVGRETAEWWGSSQAALAVAIWSRTADVRLYDERYNIPLHSLVESARTWPLPPGLAPLLLHYHYLAEPPYQQSFRRVLQRLGCEATVCEWIEERLRYFAGG